ncbi:MAG: hypothetical protein JWQ09_737 [Segetibacter sp.]|nr:hypothetical protein [Segetibacter sp.]
MWYISTPVLNPGQQPLLVDLIPYIPSCHEGGSIKK